MANTDAPTGFTPVRHLYGGTVRYDGGYTIASGYGTALFSGDPVSLAGTVATKDIERAAAATGRILGIFNGCQYTASNGDVVWTNQWVASTTTKGSADAEAFVYTDPGIVYEAQSDDGTLDATSVGQFADFVLTHAGDTSTGVSGAEIDGSTVAGTILQFKLVGPGKALDGISATDLTAANSRWECIVAEGEFTGTYA